MVINQSINQSINLFAIKGHRPLTHHTNSTNITTKRKKKLFKLCRESSIQCQLRNGTIKLKATVKTEETITIFTTKLARLP